MKVFPERLRKLRHESGLTIKAAAEKLNMEAGKYKEFESDSRKALDDKDAAKCATLYNTTIDYIYGRVDDPTDFTPLAKLDPALYERVQEILKHGHDDSIKYT